MAIEAELLDEIRAILGRNCIVEVTVTFFDETEDGALEPVDISESLEFDADTPPAAREQEFKELLGSLGDVFREASEPKAGS